MSDDPHDHESRDADEMRLECIGSFEAYTQNGEAHTIEIWTHFGAIHDRERIRVHPTLLVLTTTDGHGVDCVDQSQCRLTERPEITLSSSDPNAP